MRLFYEDDGSVCEGDLDIVVADGSDVSDADAREIMAGVGDDIDTSVVRAELRRAGVRVLVGRVADALVGLVVFADAVPATLGYIMVAPRFRHGATFGAALLTAYERHVAAAYGVRRVRVDALLELVPWYETLGYVRPADDVDADDGELVRVRGLGSTFTYARTGADTTGTCFRALDDVDARRPPSTLSYANALDVRATLAAVPAAGRRHLLRTQFARGIVPTPWLDDVVRAALGVDELESPTTIATLVERRLLPSPPPTADEVRALRERLESLVGRLESCAAHLAALTDDAGAATSGARDV